MNDFEEILDTLDAAVFSGDGLEDEHNRNLLQGFLTRWQRRLEELKG